MYDDPIVNRLLSPHWWPRDFGRVRHVHERNGVRNYISTSPAHDEKRVVPGQCCVVEGRDAWKETRILEKLEAWEGG